MSLTTTPPTVNFDTWRVNGHRMTRADHALLSVFVQRIGVAVSKHDLYVAWRGDVPTNRYGTLTTRALDQAICRLRRKGIVLLNVWSVGWVMPEGTVEVTGGRREETRGG
jgi:hypothetical protein